MRNELSIQPAKINVTVRVLMVEAQRGVYLRTKSVRPFSSLGQGM